MNRIVHSSELLQESSNELYSALLSIISPMVGTVNIKRKHTVLIKKEIRFLYRKREKFISTLFDTLPKESSVELYKTGKNLKEIQKIPDFKQEFDKIHSVFMSLDQQDQKNIILEATEKIKQLFSKMRKEIAVGLVESPDPGDMIVLGRALRCGELLLDDIAKSMKKSPPDRDETNSIILLKFLVKIMAITIGKAKVQDLYTDIAFFTYMCKPQSEEIGDDRAFIILES